MKFLTLIALLVVFSLDVVNAAHLIPLPGEELCYPDDFLVKISATGRPTVQFFWVKTALYFLIFGAILRDFPLFILASKSRKEFSTIESNHTGSVSKTGAIGNNSILSTGPRGYNYSKSNGHSDSAYAHVDADANATQSMMKQTTFSTTEMVLYPLIFILGLLIVITLAFATPLVIDTLAEYWFMWVILGLLVFTRFAWYITFVMLYSPFSMNEKTGGANNMQMLTNALYAAYVFLYALLILTILIGYFAYFGYPTAANYDPLVDVSYPLEFPIVNGTFNFTAINCTNPNPEGKTPFAVMQENLSLLWFIRVMVGVSIGLVFIVYFLGFMLGRNFTSFKGTFRLVGDKMRSMTKGRQGFY